MAILAAGLSDLKIESGQPIPGSVNPVSGEPDERTSTEANELSFPWLVQGVLGIVLVVLFFVFLFALFKKASNKRIGMTAAGLALMVMLALWLPTMTPAQPVSQPEEQFIATPPAFAYEIAPIGEPPALLFWLVVAGLVLLVAGLAAWLLLEANRQSKKEDRLAQEAAAAIQAIAEGQDIKNVIIRCYLEMERVIKEEQGIERKEAVTPREFQRYLAARGIPNAPVLQLTRLFETVRYGDQAADAGIEQEAAACLHAIQSACQPVNGGNR